MTRDIFYGFDLLTHRVIKINGRYCVTAGFFKNAYRFGQLKDTIVYSETCEFLGVDGSIDLSMANALLAGGAYTPETPAAVVYKASWPEQKVVRCTVGTLAGSTRANGITKTALIVVGEFLGTRYERSKLYDPAFTTEFRKGADQ